MDFLDPKKKRANIIRLYVGYFLMAIALGIGTLILLLKVNGYDIDRKTGDVIQNGLVFVDAHPESADIYINGENKGSTSSRFDLPAGNYNLELKRDGYRSWAKSFTLEGSSIERLVYPFLFPEKLNSGDVQLYANTPSFASQSPDRHWLVVQQPGSLTGFDMLDTSTPTGAITTLSLPAGLLTPTGATHKLELAEWSTDNRHMVMKHIFDGGSEFILVDRESPASSVNLNKHFARPISQLMLRDKKYDQYYLNDDKSELVATDLKNKQIVPIASQVISFRPHGADMLLFVTAQGAPKDKVLVKIRSGVDQYTLRELPVGPQYLLDIAQFDNKWYMAVGTGDDKRTYIYKDPFEDLRRREPRVPTPIALLRLENPLESVAFSANTRFISVQSGSKFAVYDAEEERQYRYDTQISLAPNQKASWMDGHRLAVVSADSTLTVFDFDGLNKQSLMKVNPTFIPYFDRDYRELYTIAPSVTVPSKSAVIRTEMRIKQ
ncbi:MAG: hypothetical protein JWL85_21 [Candidatus Saccharibacteria bacterium]|nr:hypothetical protein [Candidatus Saccharibacteria bacterium]